MLGGKVGLFTFSERTEGFGRVALNIARSIGIVACASVVIGALSIVLPTQHGYLPPFVAVLGAWVIFSIVSMLGMALSRNWWALLIFPLASYLMFEAILRGAPRLMEMFGLAI